MLVFAAHTPHSPLLLESINKDQLDKVQKSRDAIQELADELYAVHPDTILLLSEHPTIFPDAFSINLSDPYTFDVSDFGQLSHEKKLRPDIRLIDRMQRSLRAKGQSVTLHTDEALNYAAAVPVELLTERLPNVKLVPVSYSELDAKAHFQFGQALKDVVMESPKRIAIIAAGDLSHALTNESPAEFSKDGLAYDEKIQELISTKNTTGLLRLEDEFVSNAKETNYKVLCMLFGLIERISVKPEILSYEAPFGVGYLNANFVIK